MTKKIKSSLLLLFLVQLLFAQESNWHWQNPYPLPFIDKMYKTLDGRVLILHDNDEIYQINDDETFTKLDMNLPPLNYKAGFGKLYVISELHWIIFAPHVIHITKDGGETYKEYSFNTNWNYNHISFVDDKVGIASRGFGYTRQLVRTDNGGESWEVILSDVSTKIVQVISSDIIYVLAYLEKEEGGNKIIRTIDGGNNWEVMADCGNCDYMVKVNNHIIVKENYQYYISNDDGKTKEELVFIYDGVNDSYDGRCSVFGNTVLINNGKQIFKSKDSGVTWKKHNTGFPDIVMSQGFFRNENSYYSLYQAPHRGVMKLDVGKMELKPILGTPINDIKSMLRLETGDLAIHSYNGSTSQHRIHTSKDQGYTWDLHTLKLPDGEIYSLPSAQLRTDGSFFLAYNKRLYYYKYFKDDDYTSKKSIEDFPEFNYFHIELFDNGEGFNFGYALQEMYYSKNNFDTYSKVEYPGLKFWDVINRSDNNYWLIGRSTINNEQMASCLFIEGEIDTCYKYFNYDRTYNTLGDDLIVSSDKIGENFRINSATGMTDFCPDLKGQVRGIISKDTMIMQDHALLYLANPNTCGILEYADLDYSSYLANTVKDINLKFTLLSNGDIFGYDSGGYMIRKTNNFLDTLLYNSSKEVEYETLAQEHQFIVYPNPASDWLQVKDMPYDVECRIIDMGGREHMRGKQSLIYTGQYPSGTYIIQFIQDGRLIESQKIVIQ